MEDKIAEIQALLKTLESENNKTFQPQVIEISNIILKYVGKDWRTEAALGNRTPLEISNAIFRDDSEVWKRYLEQKTSEAFFDDFVISTNLKEIFSEILEKKRVPDLVITECFSLITEIIGAVERCRINGVYSELQAMAVIAIVLTEFSRVIAYKKLYSDAYWANNAAVRLYSRYWTPYEDYMTRHGYWKDKNKNSFDGIGISGLGVIEESKKSIPGKDDKGKFDLGCLIWIGICVLTAILGYFLNR